MRRVDLALALAPVRVDRVALTTEATIARACLRLGLTLTELAEATGVGRGAWSRVLPVGQRRRASAEPVCPLGVVVALLALAVCLRLARRGVVGREDVWCACAGLVEAGGALEGLGRALRINYGGKHV